MRAGGFGGRPSKLTEKLIVKLEDILFENRFHMGKAAAELHIHRNTLCNWFRRYPSLLKRLDRSYMERHKVRLKTEDPEEYDLLFGD